MGSKATFPNLHFFLAFSSLCAQKAVPSSQMGRQKAQIELTDYFGEHTRTPQYKISILNAQQSCRHAHVDWPCSKGDILRLLYKSFHHLILVKVELICGKIYSIIIIIIGTRFAVSQYNLPKLENTYFIPNLPKQIFEK